MVFSKGPDGSTIMRAYQPQVANPRTNAQQNQRAKMTLAGKLSKIVPAECISGLMEGSRLKNRSKFNTTIVDAATVTTTLGVRTASIEPEKVVFSNGLVPLAANMGTVTLAARTVTVALSDVIANGRNGARFIAVVMGSVRGDEYISAAFVDSVFAESQTSVVISLPAALEVGQSVLVYACPFALNPTNRRTRSAGVWLDENILAELGYGAGVQADFGLSVFGSSTPYAG